jgi:hypothetical protein
MVAILVVSFFLLGFISLFIYRWRRAGAQEAYVPLPPVPPPSLFQPDRKQMAELHREQEQAAADARAKGWFDRACAGDRQVLMEPGLAADRTQYDVVLAELTERVRAVSFAEVAELAGFVVDHELPANLSLTLAVAEHCRNSPDRSSAIMLLHLAARTDDANAFNEAFELLFEARAAGEIPALSAQELMSLAESEFWVLSDPARNSGAGFLLKQRLASARRELAAAARERE